MSSIKKDLYSGIFFFFFSIFLYAESYAIKLSKADALGPQFFPRMVAIVMAVLSVIQIFKCIKKVSQKETVQSEPAVEKRFSWNLPLTLTIVLLAGYFLLLEYVGFIILTTIYLFCQIFLLLPKGSIKNKRYLIIAATISILAPISIYLLFYKVFMIFLPAGILG